MNQWTEDDSHFWWSTLFHIIILQVDVWYDNPKKWSGIKLCICLWKQQIELHFDDDINVSLSVSILQVEIGGDFFILYYSELMINELEPQYDLCGLHSRWQVFETVTDISARGHLVLYQFRILERRYIFVTTTSTTFLIWERSFLHDISRRVYRLWSNPHNFIYARRECLHSSCSYSAVPFSTAHLHLSLGLKLVNVNRNLSQSLIQISPQTSVVNGNCLPSPPSIAALHLNRSAKLIGSFRSIFQNAETIASSSSDSR